MHKESSHVHDQCSVGVVKTVAGPRPFKKSLGYLENYYKKTAENCCMIPFASSRQWSKLILGFFSSMPNRPKQRGRARPIFDSKFLQENE